MQYCKAIHLIFDAILVPTKIYDKNDKKYSESALPMLLVVLIPNAFCCIYRFYGSKRKVLYY